MRDFRRCPTVAIVEPVGTGHRFVYVDLLVRGFVEAGYRVVLCTTTTNTRHPAVLALLGEFSDRFWVRGISSITIEKSLARSRQLQYWKFAKNAAASIRREVDDVAFFVPYLDYFLHVVGVLGTPFGSCTWSGITMRTSVHYGFEGIRAPRDRYQRLKRHLFRRALRARGLRMLFTIDPYLAAYATHRGISTVHYVPDPAGSVKRVDRSFALSQLGIDTEGGCMILIYGSITKRKGVRELVAGVSSTDALVTVVSAGVHDTDSISELDRLAERGLAVHKVDRFLSEDEESLLLSAADVVWLGYKGHYGMSGVLVKAAAYQSPVVGCPEGLIGRIVVDRGLGAVFADRSPKAVSGAIDEALRLCDDAEYLDCAQKFAREHRSNAFVDPISRSFLDTSA